MNDRTDGLTLDAAAAAIGMAPSRLRAAVADGRLALDRAGRVTAPALATFLRAHARQIAATRPLPLLRR